MRSTEARADFEALSKDIVKEVPPIPIIAFPILRGDHRADFEATSSELVGKQQEQPVKEFIPKRG